MTIEKQPAGLKLNLFPLLLIAISDSIALYKYGYRVSSYILPFTFVFFLLKLCLPFIVTYIIGHFNKKLIFVYLVILYLLLSVAILYAITPESVRVDRWDAIVHWWDAAFQGKFPYSARTRWGGFPSPLPFLQLLYLPVYFTGEIGWMNILVTAILLLYLWYRKFDLKAILIILALIFTSPMLWWEQCVRSSLFINGFLALVMMDVIVNSKKSGAVIIIIQGLVAGLFISSRLVLAIPLISALSFSYLKDHKIKEVIWLGLVIIIVFIMTLVPLVLNWSIADFLQHNVFAHHNNHMPLYFTILFITLAIASGLSSWYGNRVILLNGVILWLIGLEFIIQAIYERGLKEAYIESYGDISYFILSYATLLYCTQKTDLSDK